MSIKPTDGTRVRLTAHFDGERFILLECPNFEGLRESVEAWSIHTRAGRTHSPPSRGLWVLSVTHMSATDPPRRASSRPIESRHAGTTS